MNERLDSMEKVLSEASATHAEQMASVAARLEQLEGKLRDGLLAGSRQRLSVGGQRLSIGGQRVSDRGQRLSVASDRSPRHGELSMVQREVAILKTALLGDVAGEGSLTELQEIRPSARNFFGELCGLKQEVDALKIELLGNEHCCAKVVDTDAWPFPGARGELTRLNREVQVLKAELLGSDYSNDVEELSFAFAKFGQVRKSLSGWIHGELAKLQQDTAVLKTEPVGDNDCSDAAELSPATGKFSEISRSMSANADVIVLEAVRNDVSKLQQEVGVLKTAVFGDVSADNAKELASAVAKEPTAPCAQHEAHAPADVPVEHEVATAMANVAGEKGGELARKLMMRRGLVDAEGEVYRGGNYKVPDHVQAATAP